MSFARAGALFPFLILAGCSPMKIEQFEGATPAFAPEQYFDGSLRAWGLFQDRFGAVRRQFVVDIEGRWDGSELVLVEDFVYADGETEQRIWRIEKTGPSSYEGRADGVVGVANGQAAGNAMKWTYDFDLPVGDSVWRVRFDDWMLLQDERVLINRAVVSKLGITLGELSIFFARQDGADEMTGLSARELAAN